MAGLENLPQKFAIPALGCGLGGLHWDQVKPLIAENLAGLDRTIWVFEPWGGTNESQGHSPQRGGHYRHDGISFR
jgi:hypothetical protein